MKEKVLQLALILYFCSWINASAQQKISVLGDSYSTFAGYLTPSTNVPWYGMANEGKKAQRNNVHKVEQTWWSLLTSKEEYDLELNNSYSGTTVCHTGYNKKDCTDRSFVTRMHHLGNPDIILVFGGTNDSWAGSPIGEYQYEKWNNKDLFRFRPAFAYLLHHQKSLYPEAEIYNISNTELSEDITSSMDEICRHYGITNIRLYDIDKQAGHPSVKGMKSICKQVDEAIKNKKE